MKTEECVIVALDGMPLGDALRLADELKGAVWGFKVNDLLLREGIAVVKKLKAYGGVFADAKLHDIPNTVANGIGVLRSAGADLITVHASGGRAMLEAAVAAAEGAGVFAVTVLTSLSEEDAQQVYTRNIDQTVVDLATLAAEAGVTGIVCSPLELTQLSRLERLTRLQKVVPGIRPQWYKKADDQRRTMGPGEALAQGAQFLVIGRPITGDTDPRDAVGRIANEIDSAD